MVRHARRTRFATLRHVAAGGATCSFVLALAAAGSVAQAPGARSLPTLVPGDSVLVTPEGRFPAGPIHRLLLGSNHRGLWETPVRVEVLDLARFAGGLTPTERGGGLQTRSLRFIGADGRVYAFRSLDKDASRSLDPELRRSVAARVLQDQISALLPVSALVVDPILEAGGVLHASPVLRVMPDDPALGEFREEFAGMLGLVEERPDEGPDGAPGFAGSTRVTASDRFLELLEEDPRHQVDARAYLRARLLDFFVGDWDRHPDQWRWAEFDEGEISRWEPIPRDRDWALSNIGGWLVAIVGYLQPHYQGFAREYPPVFRASWSGRALDRHLLSGVARSEWMEVATDLQARLTDDVLRAAVAQLPESYQVQMGGWLSDALNYRRDHLTRIAEEFYALLAREVDVFATDRREVVTVTREPGGALHVVIRLRSSERPYYERRFLPDETAEVRLFKRGGRDEVVVEGSGPPSIAVRVIGGGSDDRLVDRTDGRRVYFYDDRGTNEFVVGPRTVVDERPYEEPEDPGSATHQARPRDWGTRTVPLPYALYDADLGFVLGAGFIRWGYGFREFPHRTRLSASIGLSTGSGRPRGELSWTFPISSPDLRGRLSGHWTGAEVERFYGFGNGTSADSARSFYEAGQEEAQLDLRVEFQGSDELSVLIGPRFRFFDPFGGAGRLVDGLDLYGRDGGRFAELGLTGAIAWDGRDRALNPSRGGHVEAEFRWFPALLDVRESFAGIRGSAALYRSADIAGDPVMAVRVGGERLFGEYPYQEAAYLGGGGDLRGFRNDRFAGDGAVFANVELRMVIGEFFFQVPADFGIFGLVDTGRVFHDLDSDGDLHTAVGGGVWFAFAGRANVLSIGFADSAEDRGFYAGAGFHF